MESDQDQHYSSADDQSRDVIPSPEPHEAGETIEMGPGVSVVRGNTPRPLPFEALLAASGQGAQEQSTTRSVFPGQAPAAPPLPEELEDDEQEQADGNAEVATVPEDATGPQEFIWLFEYGMEMEVAFLNSPERLAGAAFLYGPAVLQGYSLMFAEIPQTGQFLGTIVPSAQPKAEVWGVLYRVPRRVTAHNDKQLSLLDSVHAAGTSTSLFAPIPVMVRETYHEREISCGTYALTTTVRQQLRLFTPEQAAARTLLVRHIALLARKQKLPSYYLNLSSQPASVELPAEAQNRSSGGATPLPREQNTDPIPILKEKKRTATTGVRDSAVHSPSHWLVALALYQILVLLLILVFAVLQGMGLMSSFLTPNLQLLGVPWLLLIYGMLGGTVSSIVALGRARHIHLPLFAIILWFVRPYIGGVLALFVYLLLNSGLFTLVDLATSHITLFPLIGVLAGLCEGRLFTRLR